MIQNQVTFRTYRALAYHENKYINGVSFIFKVHVMNCFFLTPFVLLTSKQVCKHIETFRRLRLYGNRRSETKCYVLNVAFANLCVMLFYDITVTYFISFVLSYLTACIIFK